MLDFVRKAFRGVFVVFLWLTPILFAIGGGILANMTYSSYRGRSSGVHPILGGFLGLILGIILDIFLGGLIATFLNIDENLEILAYNSSKAGTSSGKISSGENSNSNNSNNAPPINRNYGDTWTCKKCNETNPISSSTCKGCGAYK